MHVFPRCFQFFLKSLAGKPIPFSTEKKKAFCDHSSGMDSIAQQMQHQAKVLLSSWIGSPHLGECQRISLHFFVLSTCMKISSSPKLHSDQDLFFSQLIKNWEQKMNKQSQNEQMLGNLTDAQRGKYCFLERFICSKEYFNPYLKSSNSSTIAHSNTLPLTRHIRLGMTSIHSLLHLLKISRHCS